MKVGMVAEVMCISKPWTIIPMVVTTVQDFIAAGQFRGGEQLIDPQKITQPGTILVFLSPLYEGGLDGVTPGSSCVANAYTSNHDLLISGNVGTLRGIALHAVDAVGLVHAMLLRIQALLLPDPAACVQRGALALSGRPTVAISNSIPRHFPSQARTFFASARKSPRSASFERVLEAPA